MRIPYSRLPVPSCPWEQLFEQRWHFRHCLVVATFYSQPRNLPTIFRAGGIAYTKLEGQSEHHMISSLYFSIE